MGGHAWPFMERAIEIGRMAFQPREAQYDSRESPSICPDLDSGDLPQPATVIVAITAAATRKNPERLFI
jgi:hypothetical protein